LFGFGRISKAPVVQDAADLGTCFGMEVTLDQADQETTTAGNPPAAQGSWIRRLAGRPEPK
jgi:hypothetical protein